MRPHRVVPLGLLLGLALLALWRALGPVEGARFEAAPEHQAPATAPLAPPVDVVAEEPEHAREAQDAPAPAEPRPRAEPPRATLALTLLDADTGLAFAGTIALWRVGLPETERMTAGDRLLGEHEVPLAGLRLEGLEEGEYRATCHERRYGSDDPPAFELRAPLRSIALSVGRPREREVHLELVTEAGERLTAAEMHSHLSTSRSGRDPAPAWPAPQRPKEPPRMITFGSGGAGGSFSSRSGGRWRSVSATARGFALGSFPEDRADREVAHYARLRAPGREEVRCRISGEDVGEVRYVALCVAPESVLARVYLPDGSDARGLGELARVEPVVQRIGPRDLAGLWRELEVEVALEHDEYEPLRFRWSPARADEERWLVPRARSSEDS